MPNDLIFYLLNLGVCREWHFGHLQWTYLLCLRLYQAILPNVPLASTYEAQSFLHVLHPVDLHLHICSRWCHPSSARVSALVITHRLTHQGTCRTTCSVFLTAGGGNLLLVPLGLLLVLVTAGLDSMGLVVRELLLAFLVHEGNVLLPLHIGSGDCDSDVRDHGGVPRQDASSYGSD